MLFQWIDSGFVVFACEEVLLQGGAGGWLLVGVVGDGR